MTKEKLVARTLCHCVGILLAFCLNSGIAHAGNTAAETARKALSGQCATAAIHALLRDGSIAPDTVVDVEYGYTLLTYAGKEYASKLSRYWNIRDGRERARQNGSTVSERSRQREDRNLQAHKDVAMRCRALVKALVEQGGDVNAASKLYRGQIRRKDRGKQLRDATLLTNMISARDPELVQLVLDKGANPNPKNYYYQPLPKAAAHNDEALVRQLLKLGADPNQRDIEHDYGRSAFNYAAFWGNESMVRMLIEKGADYGNPQYPALLVDAAGGGLIWLIKDMIKAGHSIHKGLYHGLRLESDKPNPPFLPIHAATAESRLETLQYLIGQGADVNALGAAYFSLTWDRHILRTRNSSGWMVEAGIFTPLMVATATGNLEAARILLQHGGNPDVIGSWGFNGVAFNALHMASDLEKEDFVQLFLDHGANPNIRLSKLASTDPTLLVARTKNPRIREMLQAAIRKGKWKRKPR